MASDLSPSVSIVVVNYRTRDMTLDCLRSIINQTRGHSYEILLVDNASGDGIIEAVEAEMPSVRCIPLATNVGFARANNIAAAQAKAPLLLLLNPDTVVLDQGVDRLVAFAAEKPDAGIWGGLSLHGDRTRDYTSCWRRISFWSLICRALTLDTTFPKSRILNPEGYGGWDRLSVREVDIICGCFMLIDRQLWDLLGGFDGIFFMYGEEADFCLRAAEAGARPTFTPYARIIHYGGASAQVATDKIIRGLSARAELIVRHCPPASRKASLSVNSFLPLVRALGYGVSGRASRNPQQLARARTWWQVWLMRQTWRSGLSKPVPQTTGGRLPC